MEINLNQYRIFYTAAKLKSISGAAEELYISQPAISRSIIKLEDTLGMSLFIRNPRGVELTEEGRVLYEELEQAFDHIRTGEEKISRINRLGIGHLKIGASASFCKYLLIPYLKEFAKRYPHIKITIECRSSLQTLPLIENGKLDIALVMLPQGAKPYEFREIGEFEDVFVAAPSYLDNLRIRGEISDDMSPKKILEHSNLMLLDEENITRQYIERYFRENSIRPDQILETTTMDLLIEFAKIGLGTACVIREFVKSELEDGTLIELPLDVPIKKRTAGFASISGAASGALLSFTSFLDSYRNN